MYHGIEMHSHFSPPASTTTCCYIPFIQFILHQRHMAVGHAPVNYIGGVGFSDTLNPSNQLIDRGQIHDLLYLVLFIVAQFMAANTVLM